MSQEVNLTDDGVVLESAGQRESEEEACEWVNLNETRQDGLISHATMVDAAQF